MRKHNVSFWKWPENSLVIAFPENYIVARMKAARTPFLVVVSLVLITSIAVGVIIKDRPVAYSNGSDIILQWATVDESSVQRFEVLRRAGTAGDFVSIALVDKKGDNSAYVYEDRSVFKIESGIYQYKIRVITGQTPAPETEIVTVSHVSSTARRTWGSIKAMFR